MKDIKKIMELDYISIKPYFTIKNLLIMWTDPQKLD